MFDPIAYNTKNAVNHKALILLNWWPFVKDPKTSEGVAEIKGWQAANGLTADGGLGPASWAALRARYAPESWLRVLPRGYSAVRAVYGDLGEKIVGGKVIVSAAWKDKHLTYVTFKDGRRRLFVVELAREFETLFDLAVEHSGYRPKSVQTWVPRYKRGPNSGSGLSAHCWCAVDFDPSLNPWGNSPKSPIVKYPLFAAFFRVAGWSCGTDWKTPDTMHLQGAKGI